MADPVAATVELLKGAPSFAAIAADRAFGGELPADQAAHMPRSALVVKPSGGVSMTGATNVLHDTNRLDLFAFGATPQAAAELMAVVDLILRKAERVVKAATLIHWYQPAGGFSSGREPDTDWPRVFKSFQVFHALESVA